MARVTKVLVEGASERIVAAVDYGRIDVFREVKTTDRLGAEKWDEKAHVYLSERRNSIEPEDDATAIVRALVAATITNARRVEA